jgi:hypothetical protein
MTIERRGLKKLRIHVILSLDLFGRNATQPSNSYSSNNRSYDSVSNQAFTSIIVHPESCRLKER